MRSKTKEKGAFMFAVTVIFRSIQLKCPCGLQLEDQSFTSSFSTLLRICNKKGKQITGYQIKTIKLIQQRLTTAKIQTEAFTPPNTWRHTGRSCGG